MFVINPTCFRTNKACPLYQNTIGNTAPINVALTEEQEEDIEKQLNTDDEDLVNVDGTKVKLSGKLLKVRIFVVVRYPYVLLDYF